MIENIELKLLLEGVYQHYGYDFRQYAHASIKRRIKRHMALNNIATMSQLQDRVLHDVQLMDKLFKDISVHVTDMFRDPDFYHSFRNNIVPLLHTFPLFHIWHAGCSTGEEVYSLAILLREADLLERARIYATDINDVALKTAQQGIYPLSHMQNSIALYRDAGGREDFSEYYVARYGNVLFDPALKQYITFCNHNLVTDQPFQRFDIILCRNVMIYFNTELKAQSIKLFHQSLNPRGLLAVGAKESVDMKKHFESFDKANRIYRKIEP
ncbi:MAG: protein-glutamate O-methyltransferase CheR [Mariprofundus sp.]|nr:protein-glutamate O-methyltransferase CheR [Mariprofundus sp.]